jgi:hypothetical protein
MTLHGHDAAVRVARVPSSHGRQPVVTKSCSEPLRCRGNTEEN